MSDKPALPIVWPSLIIAVLGLYSYVTYAPPLDSARPRAQSKPGFPPPPSPEGLRAYHARLWEDPLAVVYETKYDETKPNVAMTRQYLRDAVANIYTPAIRAQLAKTSCEDGRTVPRELIVLPVMVPGGKYGEDRERRMRMRYAVVSALSLCHYRPKFPARLSAMELSIFADGAGVDAPRCEQLIVPLELFLEFPDQGVYVDNQSEQDIPRESIEVPNCDCDSGREPCSRDAVYAPKPPILICWIDESRLGTRPLGVMAQVLDHLLREDASPAASPLNAAIRMTANRNCLCPGGLADQTACFLAALLQGAAAMAARCDTSAFPLHADVCILGPSSSDMLMTMAYENDDPHDFATGGRDNPINACQEGEPLVCQYFANKPYFARPVRIYSPRATVPFRYARNSDPNNTEQALMNFVGAKPTISGVEVSRVIGSDVHLAQAIQAELRLRGAWPSDDQEVDDYHIVLVAERDTCYGQAIVHTFDKVFLPKKGPDRKRADYVNFLTPESYLRGIDGELYHDSRSDEEKEKSREQDKAGRVVTDDIEPEGVSQKDYLVRMQQRLSELDQQLRDRGGHGVTAIGVVGSDVFDKLLILRSLRKSFPNAVFFTTDLDANFWRQSELPSTQNMIVASHFNTQLHPDLQRDVPPFRDSYQTSLFLATLLAGEDARAETAMQLNTQKSSPPRRYDLWSDEWSSQPLSPLVFEIGRHGPYQLTLTGGDPRLSPRLKDAWELHAQAANGETAQKLATQIHTTSPRERPPQFRANYVVGTRLAAVACLVLVLTVAFVAIRRFLKQIVDCVRYLVAAVVYGYRSAWHQLGLWQFPRGAETAVAVPVRPKEFNRGVANLIFAAVSLVGLVWFVSMVHRQHRDPSGEPFLLFGGVSVWPSVFLNFVAVVIGLFALRRLFRGLKKNKIEILRDLEKELPGFALSELPTFGSRRPVVLRALLYTLLIGTAMSLLFQSFPPPPLPARGPKALWIAKVSILSAYMIVIFLSMTVLLEVRLALDSIQRLRKRPLDGKSLRQARSMIQVIARRSNEVGKNLLPPFLMLLVMYIAVLPTFDDWKPSIPLWGLWALLLGSLVWSAWCMRRDAGNLREKMVLRLLDLKPAAQNSTAGQIDHFIKAIEREDRGAFRPWTEDYLLQAVAIPLGGGSGLLLLQQWLLS